jgi:hypothetical protein
MNISGDSIRVVHPLFREEGGGSIPTSPLQLHIGVIHVLKAIELNAIWHSRLPEVVRGNIDRNTHSICFGAEYDGIFYASALWTDPVSSELNGRGMLELRRLAIAPDAPRNTASRMLRVMRLAIRRRFADIKTLISYQDTDVHTGGIYRAAGWSSGPPRKSNSWTHARRSRNKEQTRADKVRWEYAL